MKHLYVAVILDPDELRDAYWFTGDDKNGNEIELCLEAFNKEYGQEENKLTADDIVDVYQVADKEIIELAKAFEE